MGCLRENSLQTQPYDMCLIVVSLSDCELFNAITDEGHNIDQWRVRGHCNRVNCRDIHLDVVHEVTVLHKSELSRQLVMLALGQTFPLVAEWWL